MKRKSIGVLFILRPKDVAGIHGFSGSNYYPESVHTIGQNSLRNMDFVSGGQHLPECQIKIY
jgi:hypothetical protein